jgi:hypothetical protein
MAFNGSGTFNLPAGNPVVAGTAIDPTVHNNTMSEISIALSDCITRDGQSPAVANIPMGGFKHTGLGAGAADGESVRYEQLRNIAGYSTTATAAGTTTLTSLSTYSQFFTGITTQTCVLPNATTLEVGRAFQICNNSTGAVSVQANGGGAIVTVPAMTNVLVTCTAIGTAAGTWHADITSTDAASGTFTMTTLGMNPEQTGTASYRIINGICHLTIPTLSGTSNQLYFTLTGLPAACQSTIAPRFPLIQCTDNGATVSNITGHLSTSTIILEKTLFTQNSWTNSGAKAVYNQCVTYPLL